MDLDDRVNILNEVFGMDKETVLMYESLFGVKSDLELEKLKKEARIIRTVYKGTVKIIDTLIGYYKGIEINVGKDWDYFDQKFNSVTDPFVYGIVEVELNNYDDITRIELINILYNKITKNNVKPNPKYIQKSEPPYLYKLYITLKKYSTFSEMNICDYKDRFLLSAFIHGLFQETKFDSINGDELYININGINQTKTITVELGDNIIFFKNNGGNIHVVK